MGETMEYGESVWYYIFYKYERLCYRKRGD